MALQASIDVDNKLDSMNSMSITNNNTSSFEILSPAERIKRFGIECIGPAGMDGILFRAGEWKPGGEYIHKLIVRNVSTTVKKLKYKLPATRYFSMAYPEVIILSPGMFKEIDVVFRPVEYAPYDDTIYMKMQDGPGSRGFHVPCGATIEKLILSTPFGVDMGWCPAYQTTSTTFKLVNEGEIDAPFRWEHCPPFVLEPSTGVIPFGKAIDIQVSIYPRDASVFVAQATCVVGEGCDALVPSPIISTKLSAICKHAFIVLSENEVSFGEVLSGTPPDATTKEVELRNTSVVPAEFELIRHEDDRDEVFDISPRKGVIEAMSEISITVKYNANAMGVYSLDRYTFKTPGNCLTTLTCKGMAMPPRITLFKEAKGLGMAAAASSTVGFPEGSPANSINFRDIEIGKKESRIFFLKNESNIASSFAVCADYAGVFQIEPSQGIIPALAQYCPVKLVFTPAKPINYCRRIFVLIGDGQPLFFDVMGTGFIRAKGEINEQRPAPLRHAHVQAYRNRLVDGLAHLNPDQLDEINREGTGKREYFALVGLKGTMAMSVSSLRYPLTRTGESSRNVIAPAHEYFISPTDSKQNVVYINKSSLDFGYTPYMASSEPLHVTITNNTEGKVMVQWSVPRVHGDDRLESPSSSTEVVSFRMDQVAGPGDLLAPVFHVEPNLIDINPGKSQAFRIFFRPKQSNRNYFSELEAYVYFKNQRTFRLVDDATMSPPWCLPVSALGHTFSTGQLLAKGKLTGGAIRGGKLVFPACYVNDALYETVALKNASNMPCTFQFVLGWESNGLGGTGGTALVARGGTAQKDEAFAVKPECGEIDAGGFVLVCVRFRPTESRKRYVQLLRCLVNGDDGGKLLLEGQGATPFLSCPDLSSATSVIGGGIGFKEDEFLGRTGIATKKAIPQGFQGSVYLNPTCVGLSTTKTFTLKNSSRLPLRFVITLPPEAVGILDIVPLKGILKGNEDRKLTILFAPQAAVTTEFKIKIQSYPVGGRSPAILDARQLGVPEPPECLQTLRVAIVAPGAVGAVLFDPPRLTADVRLVNTFEMKDIYVENVSDAAISFQLLYCTEFVPDTGSILRPRKVTPLRPLYKARDEAPPAESSDDLDHSLFCACPSGILEARSRRRIAFTFFPTNAGLYEFLVHAKLQAINPATGEVIQLPNEQAALLRLSQDEREAKIAGAMTIGVGNARRSLSRMSESDDEYYSGVVDDDYVKQAMETSPLMANITARAAFPTMVFEDIRTSEDLLVSDVEHLWSRFSFTRMNYDLSIPPTLDELKLYGMSSPDLSLLHRYNFEFTPAVLDSPTQTVYIQVRNNGFLPTSFHCHLPNEKELDLEQWCDEDEPSEELNTIICIIEELKVFSFEPKSAVLAPGETVLLTVSYSHTHLKYNGFHKIPLMVKVDQGKMFYIDLIGHTIPPPVIEGALRIVESQPTVGTASGSLALGTAGAPGTGTAAPGSTAQPPGTASGGGNGTSATSLVSAATNSGPPPPNLVLWAPSADNNIMQLQPVPIGLSHADAPLQRLEIANVSGVDCTYEVDVEPFFSLNQHNCEQPIIRLANPRGQIMARSTIYLEIYFYPVEAKTYEFPLFITYTAIPSGSSLGPPLPMIGESTDTLGQPFSIVPGTGQPMQRAQSVGASRGPSRQNTSGSEGGLNTAGTRRNKSRGTMFKKLPAAAKPMVTPPEPLQTRVMAYGYDPRNARPQAFGFEFTGGLPPAIPLFLVQDQPVSLSTDLLSYDLVPQQCFARRILIVRNVRPTATIDVILDSLESFLFKDSLLSITPSSARLAPGEHVVFEFKFTANCAPIVFADRVKIWVRELIKESGGRRTAGANARLLEKLRQKKPVADHSSVIIRNTEAINAQIRNRPNIPAGRLAGLPSTLTTHGLVEPVKGDLSNSNSGNNATQNGIATEMIQINASTSAVNPPCSRSNINNSPTQSPTRQYSADLGATGSKLGSPTRFGDEIGEGFESGTDRLGTSNSRFSGGTGTSRGGERAQLFGPAKGFIIRIKGEVFRVDTVEKLFSNGPLKGIMSDFVAPLKPVFIPASTVLVPDPRAGRSQDDAVQLNALPSLAESTESSQSAAPNLSIAPPSPGSPLGSRSQKTRSVTMIQSMSSQSTKESMSGSRQRSLSSLEAANAAATASSAKAPPSSPPKVRKAYVPGQARDTTRDIELRRTAEDVLFDAFRSILGSIPLAEYTEAVLRDANDTKPRTGGLRLQSLEAPTEPLKRPAELPAPVISGKPIYGVYFQDIVPPLPLYQRLIRELKHRGYKGLEDALELADSDTQYALAVGDGTSRTSEVVPGIPSKWTRGDGSALLADSHHYTLRKCDLVAAIKDIGVSTKGITMKAIIKQIGVSFGGRKGKVGDMTPISIVKLMNALPVDIVEKLGKRVDECYWSRLLQERLARKSVHDDDFELLAKHRPIVSVEVDSDVNAIGLGSVEKPGGFTRQTSNASIHTESSANSVGFTDDQNRFVVGREMSMTSSVSTNPVDIAIDAFMAMKMEDMDEFGNTIPKPVIISEEDLLRAQQSTKSGAATAIQRLARGADARALADKRHTAKVSNQVKEILTQDVFISTAAAVLHNTIYNLLQETSYGEFSLTADPLKFMLKRDESDLK